MAPFNHFYLENTYKSPTEIQFKPARVILQVSPSWSDQARLRLYKSFLIRINYKIVHFTYNGFV
jgi:hypothetical protein